ncbi:metal-dependent transcriptional regulator [Rosettibacter firmus]|uniref:metal-dependent transcriptional regulator n=1 Tax=Rosettibacter firmus TaxID=3111522 RepID=UPI00336BF7B3
MTTISKENYLKLIYIHTIDKNTGAATSRIAKRLSITNSAISGMAKKLAKEGLITYTKYKGMQLTKEGKKAALKVVRKHRLWESFLLEVLKIPWSEVHKEAELLEHNTSDSLIDKIDEYLGYPEIDPHGHPIPKKDGTLPKLPKLICMNQCEVGNIYELSQVDDTDERLIKYLSKIGLFINVPFEVSDIVSYDKSLIVKFSNKTVTISDKVARNIMVKPVKKAR